MDNFVLTSLFMCAPLREVFLVCVYLRPSAARSGFTINLNLPFLNLSLNLNLAPQCPHHLQPNIIPNTTKNPLKRRPKMTLLDPRDPRPSSLPKPIKGA